MTDEQINALMDAADAPEGGGFPDVAPKPDVEVAEKPAVVLADKDNDKDKDKDKVDDSNGVPEGLTLEQAIHRLKVIKGKYDAEIPRALADRRLSLEENVALKSQLRAVEDQLLTAKGAMDAMKAMSSAGGEKEEKPVDYSEGFDDELNPDFKKKIQSLGERIAGRTSAEISALRETVARLDGLMKSNAERIAESSRRVYIESVYRALPDFDAINGDVRFSGAYLDEMDGFSGKTRRELLTDANEKMDSARITAIVNDFKRKSSDAVVAPAAKPLLTDIVSPASGGVASPKEVIDPNAQVSQAELDKISDKIARGYFNRAGREKEYEAAQRTIDRAIAQSSGI